MMTHSEGGCIVLLLWAIAFALFRNTADLRKRIDKLESRTTGSGGAVNERGSDMNLSREKIAEYATWPTCADPITCNHDSCKIRLLASELKGIGKPLEK